MTAFIATQNLFWLFSRFLSYFIKYAKILDICKYITFVTVQLVTHYLRGSHSVTTESDRPNKVKIYDMTTLIYIVA